MPIYGTITGVLSVVDLPFPVAFKVQVCLVDFLDLVYPCPNIFVS